MLNAFIVANLQLICLEMKLTNICYTVQFAQRKKYAVSRKIIPRKDKNLLSLLSPRIESFMAGRVAESLRGSESSFAFFGSFLFLLWRVSMLLRLANIYINHQLKWNKVHNYIVWTRLILIKTCILITVYSFNGYKWRKNCPHNFLKRGTALSMHRLSIIVLSFITWI